MAAPYSMMTPRMEELLERTGSRFALVTLSAMRASEISDYYNQLGEGLGTIVPPQVTSVSRKPLSIAMEEIEFGKIEAIPLPAETEPATVGESGADSDAPRLGDGTGTARRDGRGSLWKIRPVARRRTKYS